MAEFDTLAGRRDLSFDAAVRAMGGPKSATTATGCKARLVVRFFASGGVAVTSVENAHSGHALGGGYRKAAALSRDELDDLADQVSNREASAATVARAQESLRPGTSVNVKARTATVISDDEADAGRQQPPRSSRLTPRESFEPVDFMQERAEAAEAAKQTAASKKATGSSSGKITDRGRPSAGKRKAATRSGDSPPLASPETRQDAKRLADMGSTVKRLKSEHAALKSEHAALKKAQDRERRDATAAARTAAAAASTGAVL